MPWHFGARIKKIIYNLLRIPPISNACKMALEWCAEGVGGVPAALKLALGEA